MGPLRPLRLLDMSLMVIRKRKNEFKIKTKIICQIHNTCTHTFKQINKHTHIHTHTHTKKKKKEKKKKKKTIEAKMSNHKKIQKALAQQALPHSVH